MSAVLTRLALDVAAILAMAFLGVMLLTAYRVGNICRNAPQACSAVVIVPQAPQAPK